MQIGKQKLYKMMKNKILIYWIGVIHIFLQSCIFDTDIEGIDPFYTTRSFSDIPLMPLVKPLTLAYNKPSSKWILVVPHEFKQRLTIDSITEIGVEAPFIYGKIFQIKNYYPEYKNSDYVFLTKFNTIYKFDKYRKPASDEIQIFPDDSVNKTFILPERWFVINVADSTIEAFFSKSKYLEYLKVKGVSGKVYNIDSVENAVGRSGVFPWFPDSVKTKLRK